VFGNSYRPRFDLVVNLLTARANQDRLITIFNGQQWRPFIHVKDIAQAILLTLDAPVETVSGEIFNVGDSRLNFTLSQIAEIIQGVFPGTAVEHIDNQDRRDYRVSFEKIHSRLGFECRWTILEGVL
jgi:nucleoside-diphosphate-sugar epimerase